jgi:putative chitobiose transport system permease protein
MMAAYTTPSSKMMAVLVRLLFIGLAVLPFLWMLSTSLKGAQEPLFSLPPQWLPQAPTLEHYVKVWNSLPILTFGFNSLIVTLFATACNLMNSLGAGIALSRFEFSGKRWVQIAVLATMFIPFQILMIPLYTLVLQLGLTFEASGRLGLWLGLAIPFAISGFGILMVKQAMDELPKDAEEAAMLDGANLPQLVWHVWVPQLRPTLTTLGLLSFLAVWGDFLWTSLLTNAPETLTLTTGLVQLQGQFSSDWRLISAGTLIMLLPSLGVFALMQRYLVASQGGSKA